MSEPAFPKSWKKSSKPHKYCPGCGQSLAMKYIGEVISEMDIQDKMIYACDIGCSLLSWDLFDIDTIQTHHGRVVPVATGLKIANSNAIILALTGDGGGYAIGAQHLINCAMRDDKISVILINNANYAMTGGQMAPTTMLQQITTTTPNGRNYRPFGNPIHGPEMLCKISSENSYIARTISNNQNDCKEKIRKLFENQINRNGFGFLEILSMCPVNWHKNASESIEYCTKDMVNIFPLGEFKCH